MQLDRQRASTTQSFWERVAVLGPEPIFVLTAQGECLVVSDAAILETGYSRAEMIGRSFVDLAVEDERETLRRRLELLRPNGDEEFGLIIRSAHGEMQNVRVIVRRDELDGIDVVVATLQRTSIARSAERLLRRKAVLEHLIERVQMRAAHSTPWEVPEIIEWVLAET